MSRFSRNRRKDLADLMKQKDTKKQWYLLLPIVLFGQIYVFFLAPPLQVIELSADLLNKGLFLGAALVPVAILVWLMPFIMMLISLESLGRMARKIDKDDYLKHGYKTWSDGLMKQYIELTVTHMREHGSTQDEIDERILKLNAIHSNTIPKS